MRAWWSGGSEPIERFRSMSAAWPGWKNRWMGGGETGERFRNPAHVYEEDLDLFGKGSLFELISTAQNALR